MSDPTTAAEDLESAAVCVIGAGTMGRGIAQVALSHGHSVTLVDPDHRQLGAARDDIRARLAKRQPDVAETLDARLRLVTTIADADAAPGTIVIEAVVEDLGVKGDVFSQALARFGEGCILATNTSSLSITAIAAQVAAPARVVGMHFFNPVPAMRLVEVVRGLQTDADVARCVAELATSWGKQVVEVQSAPGFIVNRVARPFYGEAIRLVEEGATTTHSLDTILRDSGGFRMGPFELMDLIGNDVNFKVTQTVWQAFNFDPRFAPSQLQSEVVAAGRFGRKTGHGFYPHGENSDPRKAIPVPPSHADVKARLQGQGGGLGALFGRAPAVETDKRDETGRPALDLGPHGLVLETRGLTAQQESMLAGRPVALVDRCLDPTSTTAIATAATDPDLLGIVAALLDPAGVQVYGIADTPGLVVARVVSMLINEAADAVLYGVASAEDVDLAMVLGTNYPLGPFAWASRWTAATVLEILDNVWTEYHDPRYRASRWLRTTARLQR